MSRIRLLTALTAAAVLALAGTALAAPVKVTGGSTQILISPAAANALSADHLTVTALTPATATGSTFSFPIAGGHLKAKNLHGMIRHQGGFTITNGTRTMRVRHLTLVSNRQGVSLFALIRSPAAHRATVRRIARVTGMAVNTATKTATGTVRLTRASARAINQLAGKAIAKAGGPFGTVTISPTVG